MFSSRTDWGLAPTRLTTCLVKRPDLYHRFSTEFADLPQVTVILDRRVGGGTPMHERRVRTIDDDLETLGWAIVPL